MSGMSGMPGMPGMPGMSPVGPGGPKVVQKRSRGWKCQKRRSDLKSVQRSKQGEKERFYLIVDFSANFWARETCSTSKESSEHQQFRFEIKPEVLFIKSLKEINVFEICPKNFVGSRQTRTNFWTVVQDMLKMTEKSLIQHNFTVKLGSLCSQHVCNLTFLGQFFKKNKKKKTDRFFPKKRKKEKNRISFKISKVFQQKVWRIWPFWANF